ncbi:MAG TPA: pyridoxamine 5'-phosphate oxidase family protein, partial [Chloroflexota bacterium]|nr:pyridoxamine 5'-phosphate oxidase family protein [Chloroflexota bacterium]
MALTPEEARFLDQQRVGRLATVDRGGQPNIVPVCFALVDGAIYS